MNEIAPVLSITVVLYNSASCLRESLLSVRDDVNSGFAELLVVDNASPDDSREIVEREFPEARLIKSDSNRNFAGGCNLSWPFVRGRYWLLLNPDAVVPANGLRDLVDWMEQHPELGAASPKLVDKQGRDQCAGRRFQSITRSILELSRLHLLLPQQIRANMFLGSYWNGSDHTNVDWVPGAALVARREAVETAGLLSEEVLFYGEDSEWCWRIRRAGWRIGVCGHVSFEHEEGQSTSRTWDDDDRRRRMWRGIYDACRMTRGSLYTKVLTAVNTLAFAIEAYDPRVSPDDRTKSRERLNAHMSLLKGDQT